jgi:hypothetical protein
MPPSLVLVGRVDRLFALYLRALEGTASLLVALEAKFLLLVPFTLMRSQSSSDDVEISSSSVLRRLATASAIASTTTKSTEP